MSATCFRTYRRFVVFARLPGMIFALLGIASSAALSDESNLERGLQAYEAGDYETALNVFEALAEQGDAFAQHNLGVMYLQGTVVPQNNVEAVRWYRLAAEQENAHAQNN